MRLLMRLDEIRVKTQTPTALFPTQKKIAAHPLTLACSILFSCMWTLFRGPRNSVIQTGYAT
jgi:hypothetical protein